MNYIFPILVLFSFFAAAVNGEMAALSMSVVNGGQKAVELIIRLVSMLCLWGGIMEIAEQSGITKTFSRLMTPIIKLVFPKIKNEKYALEAISMNITANILGLGNAATPLGLEAMRRLQLINPYSDKASDEMVVFVVMNTAAMHIIPTTVATLRGQYGSQNPMEIMPASILTSACALSVALFMAKTGNRLSGKRRGSLVK